VHSGASAASAATRAPRRAALSQRASARACAETHRGPACPGAGAARSRLRHTALRAPAPHPACRPGWRRPPPRSRTSARCAPRAARRVSRSRCTAAARPTTLQLRQAARLRCSSRTSSQTMMGRFSASLYVGKMTDSRPLPAAVAGLAAARLRGGPGERAIAALARPRA